LPGKNIANKIAVIRDQKPKLKVSACDHVSTVIVSSDTASAIQVTRAKLSNAYGTNEAMF